MNTSDINNLLQENVSLKYLNTWRVGGEARYYSEPNSIKELIKIKEFAKVNELRLLVLGKGSNILFGDNGFDGIAVNITNSFNNYSIIDGEYIEVQSGVLLPTLAIQLSRMNIDGYDFLTGIPGTMGGAIVMNAGCIGKEIKDYLISVKYIDPSGSTIEKNVNDINMGFRFSEFINNNCIIISCKLRYKKGISKEECINKTKRAISIRKTKFPMNVATAGSTFKSHPDGPYPGKLIEEAGLKGFKIGGAFISEEHGNWIINSGDATSHDIKRLIDYIIETVYKKFYKKLETEVIIIE